MIIVFDLDDTLYPEITYVKSGFMAVSNFLGTGLQNPNQNIYNLLCSKLEKYGRGKVFDKTLEELSIYSRKLVQQCLSVYRGHTPNIQMPGTSSRCLDKLHSYPLYLVTDGNKLVQYRKVQSLGIESSFKRIYITHRFGLQHAKPSTYCFQQIIKSEHANPEQLVYIGDNPSKDFVNLKKEGFKTIRVLTGNHKDDYFGEKYEADININGLDEINQHLLENLN